ncbi:MAG: hypothetical protein K0S41_1450 [Anaerocolumna sp.]|nr:hypothetical protein [Anaerocolumna sp.]
MDISHNTVMTLDELNYSLSYIQNFSSIETDKFKEAYFLPHYKSKPQTINKLMEDGKNCVYLETDGKKLERHGVILAEHILVKFDMAVEIKIKPLGDSEGVAEFWLINEEYGKWINFKLFGGYYGTKKETILEFNGERIYFPIKLWDWGNWYYLHIQLTKNKTVMALLDENRCILARHCFDQSVTSLFESFSIAISQEMGMDNIRSNFMKALITDIKVGVCLNGMQDLMRMPTKNDLIVATVEENLKELNIISNIKERCNNLLEIWKEYEPYEPKIDFYLRPLINEYIIFHNLSLENSDDIEFNNTFQYFKIVCEFKNHSPKELTEALNGFSNYHILKSKFYKEFSDDINEVVYNIYKKVSTNSFFHMLFNHKALTPYYIFKAAIFGDKLDANDYNYHDWQEYYYSAAFQKKNKIKMIGDILKAVDALMRSRYGYPVTLEKPALYKAYESAIVSEVDRFCSENNKTNSYVPNDIRKTKKTNELAPKPVVIDTTKLGDIRMATERIQEQLITDESWQEVMTIQTKPKTIENYVPINPFKTSSEDNMLSEVQIHVIKALLDGNISEIKEILSENGLMLSVVMDEINEILFDQLSDNCIIFDENDPVIVEDYMEELKGIINL